MEGWPLSGDNQIWIVDEHESSRVALCELIATQDAYEVHCYSSAQRFLREARVDEPAGVVLDLDFEEHNSYEVLAEIAEKKIRSTVITTTARPSIESAVLATQLGALTYLQKPLNSEMVLHTLAQAIGVYKARKQAVVEIQEIQGRIDTLTPREREVLGMVVEGLSSKEIAARLYLSAKTISLHRAHIMKKMEARGVAHLVRMVLFVEPLSFCESKLGAVSA